MDPISVLVAQAEMVNDEHYKFYRVYITESIGLVAWGRIGTEGQHQWVTPDEANHRWESKLRKGYSQVSFETVQVYPGGYIEDPELAEVIDQHLSGPIAASRLAAHEEGTKYRVIAPGCYVVFMKHDGGSSFRNYRVDLQVGDVITFLGYRQGFGDSPAIANFGDESGQSYGIDSEFHPGSWGSPDWSRLEEIRMSRYRQAADRITDGETGYPDAWDADYNGHPCPVCGGKGWLEDEDELAWIGCDNCGRTGVEPEGTETNWYQISPKGIPLAASRKESMYDDYDEDEIFYDDIQEGNGGWEPEEEDLATDGSTLWELTESAGGSWVSNGNSWNLGNDWQGNIKQIMDDRQYWPNVWWVDDHGGMQLIEWDTVQ